MDTYYFVAFEIAFGLVCVYLFARCIVNPLVKKYAYVNSSNVYMLYEKEEKIDWSMPIFSSIYIKSSTYSKIEFIALKETLIKTGQYIDDKGVVEFAKDINSLKRSPEFFKQELVNQIHYFYNKKKNLITSSIVSVTFVLLIIISFLHK